MFITALEVDAGGSSIALPQPTQSTTRWPDGPASGESELGQTVPPDLSVPIMAAGPKS